MFQKHDFPTLTERIESWLETARAAVKREERSENPEHIAAESVPRTRSLTALLRDDIARSMTTADDERIEAALTRAL